jgi:oligoribonuclease NrnB/cAMP/cGMP phosphodiesterase (DHH superfamily)
MIYIVHHNDLDGRAAAGILLGSLVDDVAEVFEMSYGQKLPEAVQGATKEDTVYMLDFSLQPFTEMLELDERTNFVWIDHHQSAINEAAKLGCHFSGDQDSRYCGAELTLLYCHRGILQPEIQAVTLVGDWDTWRHKDIKDSCAPAFKVSFDAMSPKQVIAWFEEAVQLQQTDRKLLQELTEAQITTGKALLEYEKIQDAELMKARAFDCTFSGKPAIVANIGQRGSNRFESVYDPDKHDLIVGFALENTGKFTVSLYSTKDEIDCGELAKELGKSSPYPSGGGHKGAAGFQTSYDHLMSLTDLFAEKL